MLVADGPGVQGGAFEQLCSIFEHDSITIWYSGESVERVSQGLPEGGTMGTTTYTTLPDSLIKELQLSNLGIGVGVVVPKFGEITFGKGLVGPARHSSASSARVCVVG